MKPAHRRAIRFLLVGLFGLLALGDAFNLTKYLVGIEEQHPVLIVWQFVNMLLAAATAVGAWKLRRWSAATALAYGITVAAMVLSLGPLLELPNESRTGLLAGGAAVLAIALLSAWQLRRVTTPDAWPRPQ